MLARLASIRHPRGLQIVTIDNGSGDGTGELLRDRTDRLPMQVLSRRAAASSAASRNGRSCFSRRLEACLSKRCGRGPGLQTCPGPGPGGRRLLGHDGQGVLRPFAQMGHQGLLSQRDPIDAFRARYVDITEQDHESRATADDDGVDERREQLGDALADRMADVDRRRDIGRRSEAGFVREQAPAKALSKRSAHTGADRLFALARARPWMIEAAGPPR